MTSGTRPRRRASRGVALGSVAVLAGTLAIGTPATAAEQTAAVFAVVQEGLTVDEGEALAKEFGIGNALEPNGAFSYVNEATFNHVPLVDAGEGEDESGRPTTAQALDLAAVERLKPISTEEAIKRAEALTALAGLSPELRAEPVAAHTELTIADQRGRSSRSHPLDTTVSHRFSLAGLPVGGQGARLRVTFAPDGSVSQLSHGLRKVERAGDVEVIGVEEAAKACAALYPAGVRQQPPTLGYQFPELSATKADGRGSVSTIFPQYTCNPVAETGDLAHRLVPAVPGSAPSGKLSASRSGDQISAGVTVSGGTAPYTYTWSSSSTALFGDPFGAQVGYDIEGRDKAEPEQVTVEVTDANGLTATASVTLDGDGDGTAETVPGGGGYGELAIGPVDVGIEQTVDEWACAQASANGFRSVMQSKGVPVAFDWRGRNAWEIDFKERAFGGWDHRYVDNVDATWYTGHGWPGGFTFKSNVTDDRIVPGDARWGNGDLEWLQLESCQVLRDTTGTHDYFTRWDEVFRGLHIMNGFHTNAYCVNGGTGRSFAEYLFPKKFLWWTIRPAQRVQRAWALMAIDKEPAGVVYRSVAPYRYRDGVTTIGDYFWGQGGVGPDMTVDWANVGMISITGTV